MVFAGYLIIASIPLKLFLQHINYIVQASERAYIHASSAQNKQQRS